MFEFRAKTVDKFPAEGIERSTSEHQETPKSHRNTQRGMDMPGEEEVSKKQTSEEERSSNWKVDEWPTVYRGEPPDEEDNAKGEGPAEEILPRESK